MRHLNFSVVSKPTGAACNLDCQYCFFLSKEFLYQEKQQRMSSATLERYIARYLEESPDGEVTFLWQGGEPTLRGLPFFKDAVRLCQRYQRPTQRVNHAIQTNATLVNQEWAKFFAKHHFLVGVSIDGPQPLHDAYRINRAGHGTHSMVVRGWEALQENGVETNVLCCVHAANQEYPEEVYTYFRDELGAQYIQFIPVVERSGGENLDGRVYTQSGSQVTERSVTPEGYGRFLAEVFHLWVRSDVGKVFVQDCDTALSAIFQEYPLCVHSPSCGNNWALEYNGDVYACDHWVEPDWLLGNIAEDSFGEIAEGELNASFARKKRQLTQQCRRCPYLNLCWGGCPKDRCMRSADGEEGHNYLCEGYKVFYQAALPELRAMAQLIRTGHAPAEIMDNRVRPLLGLEPRGRYP